MGGGRGRHSFVARICGGVGYGRSATVGPVAEETEFAMGAEARCSDGPAGKVIRVIVDPATDTVTHLVIEPRHRQGAGRLVPLNLVDVTADGIRLRCTAEEFGVPAWPQKRHAGRVAQLHWLGQGRNSLVTSDGYKLAQSSGAGLPVSRSCVQEIRAGMSGESAVTRPTWFRPG